MPELQAEPVAPADEQEPAGNVSSDELDKQEISNIAAELKKDLQPKSAPASPKPAPTEGTVRLNSAPKSAAPAPEDTIYIDNEGVLHANGPAAPEPSKQ